VRLLELAQQATELFSRQAPVEKRRLLAFLLSNCSWKNRRLSASFRQPFDMIADTSVAHQMQKAAKVSFDGSSAIWLRR